MVFPSDCCLFPQAGGSRTGCKMPSRRFAGKYTTDTGRTALALLVSVVVALFPTRRDSAVIVGVRAAVEAVRVGSVWEADPKGGCVGEQDTAHEALVKLGDGGVVVKDAVRNIRQGGAVPKAVTEILRLGTLGKQFLADAFQFLARLEAAVKIGCGHAALEQIGGKGDQLDARGEAGGKAVSLGLVLEKLAGDSGQLLTAFEAACKGQRLGAAVKQTGGDGGDQRTAQEAIIKGSDLETVIEQPRRNGGQPRTIGETRFKAGNTDTVVEQPGRDRGNGRFGKAPLHRFENRTP